MHNDRYKVSVVIPVYNAEQYIVRSVESVVHLPATGEVILVDDASSDGSIAICKELAAKYDHVFFYQHADRKNHGASGARNLGITIAKCEHVSFLDADDYYLPNRFDVEEPIFLNDPSVDGVYGFTLAAFESEKAKQMFSLGIIPERTTFSKKIEPPDLFNALILGGYGCFHTSGITVKKSLFNKTGMFNPKIRYVEDTELWYKLSLEGKLVAGSIDEPIAMRWVHETNSIHESGNIKPFRELMIKEVFDWAIRKPFDFAIKNAFFIALQRFSYSNEPSAMKILMKEIKRNPSLLSYKFFYKKLHLIILQSNATGNK